MVLVSKRKCKREDGVGCGRDTIVATACSLPSLGITWKRRIDGLCGPVAALAPLSDMTAARSLRPDELALVERLRGQHAFMPDISALTPGFESRINPAYLKAKGPVEEWLKTCAP
jgi:hypothetical protein